MRRIGASLVALGLAASALGCDRLGIGPQICDRSEQGNPVVRYTQGEVVDGVYTSSAWDGELLYFPGGMRYEIEHKLGQVPRFWQFYLSFDQEGVNTGVIAQAAGNQAELRGINETSLEVVNGSCVDYWLLVVAGVEGAGDVGDVGAQDAGAGEGGTSP